MAVKIGEGQSEITAEAGIKKTEDLKIRIPKTKEISFKPSEDLKKGDKIKITVEKV